MSSDQFKHTESDQISIALKNKGYFMRLVSWNVNGIRAVMKKDFISSLNSMETDILCLQETKAQD